MPAIPPPAPAISPFSYAAVSLYDHWCKDLASFWSAMASAKDPAEAVRFEFELDGRLWRDYVDAMYDVWTLPLKVAGAMTAAVKAA